MHFKDKRWYLVQCKPRESFRAEQHLLNQNYKCFHPTYTFKRKYKNKIRTEIQPLFRYYLFVLLGQDDNWSAIRSTRGVSSIVRFNGVPASLSCTTISVLQQYCSQLQRECAKPLFKIGDRVLVTEGCFRHLEAIVTAASSVERVTLLFNLFNREQEIELPVTVLEAVI